MASARRAKVAVIKGSGDHAIEIAVSYCKGGINYYNYERNARGYSLVLQPMEIKPDGLQTFILGSGCGSLIEGASRFSKKRLLDLTEAVWDGDKVKALYLKVTQDPKHSDKGFPTWEHVVKERKKFLAKSA